MLLKNESQVIADSGIGVVSVPDADGEGYEQEVFIPWSALELSQAPAAGEVWKFNLGRESQHFQQYTTWSQVVRNFGVGHGVIKFTDPSPVIKQLVLGNNYGGRNRISGELTTAAQVELTDPAGKVYSVQAEAEKRFELIYPVSAENAGEWRLTITGSGGESYRDLTFNTQIPDKAVQVREVMPVVISGDRMWFDAEFCLGNAGDAVTINAALIDGTGQEFEVEGFSLSPAGKMRLYIDTTGMPAGEYRLRVWCGDMTRNSDISEDSCRILPTAF